jgi:hypothetical protein
VPAQQDDFAEFYQASYGRTFTATRLHVPAVSFSAPGYTFIAW